MTLVTDRGRPLHRQTATVTEEAHERADLAIVIVHGIGSQAIGSTLVSWAEPIVKEIQHRAAAGSAGVSYGTTRLQSDPATATVTFRTDADVSQPLTWKFLEARWAAAFPWPGAGEVLKWARNFIPRASQRIWHQLTRPVGAYKDALDAVSAGETPSLKPRLLIARIAWVGYGGFWFVVTAFAVAWTALTAIVFATALALVGAIPFVGKRIAPITTQLVASVGDAYLFTSRPLHAAAMVDSILTVLDDAKSCSEKVCIIAHSQGAALAVRALLSTPRNVLPDLLITVGAGVNLLAQETGPVEKWIQNAGTMQWINIWTPWDPVPSGPIADCARDEARRAAQATSVVGALRPLFGDPVTPSGLAERDRDGDSPDGPEEWPVYNRASVVRDHVTYVDNVPQVIRPITDRLFALTRGQPGALPALDEGHIRRVRYLGAARLVSGFMAVAFVVFRVVAQLSGGPNAQLLGTWVRHRYEGIFGNPLVGSALSRLLAGASVVAYEAAMGIAVFVVAYLVIRVPWSRWDATASTMAVRESNQTEYPFNLSGDAVAILADRPKGRTLARSAFKLLLMLYCVIAYFMVMMISFITVDQFGGFPEYGQKTDILLPLAVQVPPVFVIGMVIIFQVFEWPRGGARLQAILQNGASFDVQPADDAPLLVNPFKRSTSATDPASRAGKDRWGPRRVAITALYGLGLLWLMGSLVVVASTFFGDSADYPVGIGFLRWSFNGPLITVLLGYWFVNCLLCYALFVLWWYDRRGSHAARLTLCAVAAAYLVCVAALVLWYREPVLIAMFGWHVSVPLGIALAVVGGGFAVPGVFATKRFVDGVWAMRKANGTATAQHPTTDAADKTARGGIGDIDKPVPKRSDPAHTP